MGASITLAGESLIAQKQAAQQSLDVQRFIFANVPGLDPSGPVDRAAGKPAADRIVYTAEIPNDNAGFVNPNQVVYSLQVGSDVGDWDFNWIGLETAEGVLFAVAYVPTQQKRRNVPPMQIGNNITRNFLVVYDGAQALTGVTIDASTWQHDFTVRLAGIDERERQSNRDIFGRACFFGSALQVEKVGSAYQVKPGTAYIEGIRVQRGTALAIVPPALPTTAWLDVALQRELSDVVASWSVVFGTGLADRIDSAGTRHYLVPIADLVSAASLLDRRPAEAIGGPLVQHFAARNGDYEFLRARATTKEDVELGNLPNAKSDDPESDSSDILATTKALKRVKADLQVVLDQLTTEISQQDYKNSVMYTTTGALGQLSGLAVQAGGDWSVPLPAGARVLVKDQGARNGIYLASANPWTRAPDADLAGKITTGLFVQVEKGVVYRASAWRLTTEGPIVLDTTPLVFEIAFGITGVAAGSYDRVVVDKWGRVVGGDNPRIARMILADEKPSGTHAGPAIAGINERVLNTVRINTIVGASLANNKVVLPPGRYHVHGWGTSGHVGSAQSWLFNETLNEVAILGVSLNGTDPSYSEFVTSLSMIVGSLELDVETTFRVQTFAQYAYTTWGLGYKAGSGKPEVYTFLEITKEP